MDREQETEQGTGRNDDKPRPRSWTQRTTGPLRFRRYTDTDGGGTPGSSTASNRPPGQPSCRRRSMTSSNNSSIWITTPAKPWHRQMSYRPDVYPK